MISQAVELRYAEPWGSQYDPGSPGSAEAFSRVLYVSLLQIAARIKHSGFSGEKEWRLVPHVMATPVTVRHRAQAHANRALHSRSAPGARRGAGHPPDNHWTGPEQSRADAGVYSLYATSGLLESDGSPRGEIRQSKIPYRYW
jgi:hypothetical protein